MRGLLATIAAALVIGVLGVLVGTALTGPDQRTINASPVSNWIPLADPAGGPNFFPLDPDARY